MSVDMTIGKAVDNGKRPGTGRNRALAKARQDARKPPRASRRSEPARCPKNQGRLCADCHPPGRLELHPITPAEAVGYVYILRNAVGMVKVGFAHCAFDRIRTVRRSWVRREHLPVSIVRVLRMPRRKARRAELAVHHALKGRKVRYPWSEWFATTPSRASRLLNDVLDILYTEHDIETNKNELYRLFGPRG